MSELNHIAIIMDGNGRWAKSRFHPRVWGHIRGASIVSDIVEEADHLGIKALTLYAFSTENFSRPLDEVKTLFKLLKKFLKKERSRILKNKICFKVIGDISSLPTETKDLILNLENETKDFSGLKLSFAFGYGSRKEIIDSINKHIEKNPGTPINEALLEQNFYRPESGAVDLLIRTGGDFRISNYLLWQIAYAELYFVEKAWPDFTKEDLRDIYLSVKNRERRFGTVGASNLENSQKNAQVNKQILKQGSSL